MRSLRYLTLQTLKRIRHSISYGEAGLGQVST